LDTGALEPAVEAIVTNPPYGLGGRIALRFIERSLELTKTIGGIVAMLLKVDYDRSGQQDSNLRPPAPKTGGRPIKSKAVPTVGVLFTVRRIKKLAPLSASSRRPTPP